MRINSPNNEKEGEIACSADMRTRIELVILLFQEQDQTMLIVDIIITIMPCPDGWVN